MQDQRFPEQPVTYGREPITYACIEWNGAVPLDDFVPALQTELLKHGVTSRVFDAGSLALCRVTISYTGYVQWDKKLLSDDYSAYLIYISLTLRRDGKILGSAQYKIGRFQLDKWSSSSDKLGPLVDAILAGNVPVSPAASP